jgi:homoaconitase/3-isopropylmalate dehydratase large subunit
MTQIISLKDVSDESKIMLLKELGFSSDGTYVLDNSGEKVKDIYIDEPVKISNMAILPGSTIILDDNPLSIASYLEDHPDVV